MLSRLCQKFVSTFVGFSKLEDIVSQIPWNRVVLEKLTVSQLVEEFPLFVELEYS